MTISLFAKYGAAFFCFILFFCPKDGHGQPTWITEKPVNSNYYIGIGYSQKKADHSHIEIAKNQALQSIASEIKISVSSRSVARVIESNNQIKESFEQNIQTSTEASLQSYELVDTWENEKDYWVYYRLSKQVYKNLQQQKKEKAIALAADFYKKALYSRQNGQIDEAIRFYIKVLETLENYLNEPNEYTFNNEKILLANEAYQEIYGLVSSIKLKPIKEEYSAKQLAELNKEIEVQVSYIDQQNGTESLIENISIHFSFIEGEGIIETHSVTNDLGIASAKLSKIKSTRSYQSLRARLSLYDENKKKNSHTIVKSLLKEISRPSVTIKLAVKKQNLYLEVQEYINESKNDGNKIESILKNQLSQLGYSFVSDKTDSELTFKVTARARDGGEKFGLYTSFVDIDFSVINEDKKDIYHTSIQGIKGMQLSYQKAAYDAFEKASKQLIEKLNTESGYFNF